MTVKSGLIDLTNIDSASKAKKEMNKVVLLAIVGLLILLLGIWIAKISTENVYWASWLVTSGFITIIYALIKLVIFMID